ncbi:RNA polymerase subunit sigma-70 [Actinoplanes sp. NPDC049596]|uniref:RNA polymerase subunit sigma-70 n=1 Tax=unclassified Actinoplanes TaxID=2626549 RepID=UPI00343B3D17
MEPAFRTEIAPYERELRLHCYRMLGSLTDAEDALQETLLAAWQGLPAFEGRSSVRTWLYRIATNRCLNARRARPPEPVAPFPVPTPSRLGEVTWLQPFPDELLPDSRAETLETVELAFVAALQRMPRRQAAALILCDVLEFSYAETAGMLKTTATAVKGALQRARAARPAPPAGGSDDDDLARRFARAFTAGDVDGVIALLTDDAWLSMPPAPHEYFGRLAIAGFLARSFGYATQRLTPARANGQPAFRVSLDGAFAGIIVLTVRGESIEAVTRFHEPALAGRFGQDVTIK